MVLSLLFQEAIHLRGKAQNENEFRFGKPQEIYSNYLGGFRKDRLAAADVMEYRAKVEVVARISPALDEPHTIVSDPIRVRVGDSVFEGAFRSDHVLLRTECDQLSLQSTELSEAKHLKGKQANMSSVLP